MPILWQSAMSNSNDISDRDKMGNDFNKRSSQKSMITGSNSNDVCNSYLTYWVWVVSITVV